METIMRFIEIFTGRLELMREELSREGKVKRENGDEWEYVKTRIGAGIADAYAGAVERYAKIAAEGDRSDPAELFEILMGKFNNRLNESWQKECSVALAHNDYEEEEKINVKRQYSDYLFNVYNDIWRNISEGRK